MQSQPSSPLSLAGSVANAAEIGLPLPTRPSNHFHPMCLPLPTHTSSIRSTMIKRGNKTGTVASQIDPGATEESRESPLRSQPKCTSSSQAIDLVWEEGSSAVQPYAGLDKDDDLWFTKGDCLVFFGEEHRSKPPVPSFRVESKRIETIPFLKELLTASKPLQRVTRRHMADLHQKFPRYPNAHRLVSPRRHLLRRSVGYLPLPTMVSPLKFPELGPNLPAPAQRRTTWNAYAQDSARNESPEIFSNGALSTAVPLKFQNTVKDELDDESESCNGDYEIWFAIPTQEGEQEHHLHKLAIRNLMAMLHGKAIVGPQLLQSLSDVQCLLDAFSSQDLLESSGASGAMQELDDADLDPDHVIPLYPSIVTTYIQNRNFDDVRYNLQQALRFLAWTELPCIRWTRGYIETFAHVVGMMTPDTSQQSEFKELTQITRHNLENAFSALQLTVLEAEEKLDKFDFSQMWTLQKLGPCGTRRSFEAFRLFIVEFYADAFGNWPPSTAVKSGRWLNRDIVGRLQKDLGALYDYLVNRDIHWDTMKASYRRDWEMSCNAEGSFKADHYVPVTDILIGFDDFHGLLHIPHPYPLLPVADGKAPAKKRFFHSFSRLKYAASRDHKDTLKASLAYGGATNINKVAVSLHAKGLSETASINQILEAFETHERSAPLHGVSLQEARLGRWILLYGILQVLSLVSVDIGGLRYTKDVRYFLCSSIQGCPPWRDEEDLSTFREPSQIASYCWSAHDQWEENKNMSGSPVNNERTNTFIRTSQATETIDWEDTEIGQSPSPSVYDGAAQAVPLRHGVRGRILDIGETAIGNAVRLEERN